MQSHDFGFTLILEKYFLKMKRDDDDDDDDELLLWYGWKASNN